MPHVLVHPVDGRPLTDENLKLIWVLGFRFLIQKKTLSSPGRWQMTRMLSTKGRSTLLYQNFVEVEGVDVFWSSLMGFGKALRELRVVALMLPVAVYHVLSLTKGELGDFVLHGNDEADGVNTADFDQKAGRV